MPASTPNPKIDWYFSKVSRWQDEFRALREIVLGCGLTEELKWTHPCYTLAGANVVLLHGSKEYSALFFHKGALLKDELGILIEQTKNVQAARQVRFTDVQQITNQRRILKSYIRPHRLRRRPQLLRIYANRA